MIINVVGPPGSGKTTLAKEISQKFNLDLINLDDIFYDPIPNQKKRRELLPEEYQERLGRILNKNNLVIEGIYPITEVFEKADLIVRLKTPIWLSLFRQWKRYFTDPKQRKGFGFVNNLRLSRGILKKYLLKEDPTKSEDPIYFRNRKLERILSKYKIKTVTVTSNKDKEEVFRKILTLG